jgi:hypothetical protein
MPNVPAVPTDYVPLNPVRLLDTRSVSTGASTIDGNDLGCGPVGQQQVRTLVVEGRGGVPTAGVDAVAVNVTVVSPTASNFLTVYPSGTARPGTSNINFVAGQTIPNMAIVRVGTDGTISIYNEEGATQVIIDVVGWFPDGSDYTATSTPERLLDTRTSAQGGGGTIDGSFAGGGALGQGQTLLLPVVGRGTIPPLSSVGAVALNVTVVAPTAANYLTVYPSGTALPTASNLNFAAGQTIANMVIAKVGADGKVAIFNNAGSTQVLVDIVGYFPLISEYTPIVPERFLDTRSCSDCTTIARAEVCASDHRTTTNFGSVERWCSRSQCHRCRFHRKQLPHGVPHRWISTDGVESEFCGRTNHSQHGHCETRDRRCRQRQ